MSQMFWILLALFVVVDIVVIALVMRRFMSGVFGSRGQTGKVIEDAHVMVGDYLRVNYSGDPGHLATALSGLVPVLRDMLRSHGVEPRPEVIHALLEVSAARHRIASMHQVREALASLQSANGDPAKRRAAA